jgi:hypothetical protein
MLLLRFMLLRALIHHSCYSTVADVEGLDGRQGAEGS